MDNYDIMAGSCPNCVAADKEIMALEDRLDAADRETLAAFDIERARLTAADALASDADKAVLAIQDAQACIWSLLQEEGQANNVADLLRSIDIVQTKLASTLIKYREVSK